MKTIILVIFLFFLSNSKNLFAANDYNCNLHINGLNNINLPNIYSFNLLNLKFTENDNIWKLIDLNLDKNLKINLRKSFEYEVITLKKIIKRGRANNNEKYIIELMQEMDYGFTFNQFMNEIKNANQSEKNYLTKIINEASIEGLKYINNIDFSDFAEIKNQILSEFDNIINISIKNNRVTMTGYDNENSLKISIMNLNDNNHLKPINVNFDIEGYDLSFIGNCKKASNSSSIAKTYEEIDCFKDDNINLFPVYCSSKILELYPISESEDGSLFISNDENNNNFIEFCKKSTLDSLDKDVALLCLNKMN